MKEIDLKDAYVAIDYKSKRRFKIKSIEADYSLKAETQE